MVTVVTYTIYGSMIRSDCMKRGKCFHILSITHSFNFNQKLWIKIRCINTWIALSIECHPTIAQHERIVYRTKSQVNRSTRVFEKLATKYVHLKKANGNKGKTPDVIDLDCDHRWTLIKNSREIQMHESCFGIFESICNETLSIAFKAEVKHSEMINF